MPFQEFLSSMDPDLPPNWEAVTGEDGRTYYWNAKQRVKTYDWSLPDGWEAHKDDQGRTYYWNATRKIKSYERSRTRTLPK